MAFKVFGSNFCDLYDWSAIEECAKVVEIKADDDEWDDSCRDWIKEGLEIDDAFEFEGFTSSLLSLLIGTIVEEFEEKDFRFNILHSVLEFSVKISDDKSIVLFIGSEIELNNFKI